MLFQVCGDVCAGTSDAQLIDFVSRGLRSLGETPPMLVRGGEDVGIPDLVWYRRRGRATGAIIDMLS